MKGTAELLSSSYAEWQATTGNHGDSSDSQARRPHDRLRQVSVALETQAPLGRRTEAASCGGCRDRRSGSWEQCRLASRTPRPAPRQRISPFRAIIAETDCP